MYVWILNKTHHVWQRCKSVKFIMVEQLNLLIKKSIILLCGMQYSIMLTCPLGTTLGSIPAVWATVFERVTFEWFCRGVQCTSDFLTFCHSIQVFFQNYTTLFIQYESYQLNILLPHPYNDTKIYTFSN